MKDDCVMGIPRYKLMKKQISIKNAGNNCIDVSFKSS